jgi:hypothetical protein
VPEGVSVIDLRTTEYPPVGLSSSALESRSQQATRFYWVRACQYCLSTTTMQVDGLEQCTGCRRVVIVGSLEGEPPR